MDQQAKYNLLSQLTVILVPLLLLAFTAYIRAKLQGKNTAAALDEVIKTIEGHRTWTPGPPGNADQIVTDLKKAKRDETLPPGVQRAIDTSVDKLPELNSSFAREPKPDDDKKPP